MKTFRHLSPQLYSSNKSLYLHYSSCNAFVHAVHCRLPFHTTFPTLNSVHVEFSVGGHEYLLFLTISEYEKLLGYSFMHIDEEL